MFRHQLILLIALFSLLPLHAFAFARQRVLYDQSYGPFADQKFDIWIPAESSKPLGLIVHIHGGGFIGGDKMQVREQKEAIRKYNEKGFAYTSINYRFLDKVPVQQVLREDIAGYIQFMRHHAKAYNIDPKRVYVYGDSAGASASLWLGTHPDLADPTSSNPLKRESTRVQGIGHINGQLSLNYVSWFQLFGKSNTFAFFRDWAKKLYGIKSDQVFDEVSPELLQDIDSVALLTKDDAPIITINEMADESTANINQVLHHQRHTRELYRLAQQTGIPSEIHLGTVAEPHKFRLRDWKKAKERTERQVFKFFTELDSLSQQSSH